MKTVIVDTNAFLRFFLNDIVEQKKAFEDALHKAKRNEIILIVPQIIIFEIDFALAKYYHFSKGEIIKRLKSIISRSYLQVQDQNTFIEAIELYVKYNIAFVDCFLISKAKVEKADLFTFDQKLKKLQHIP